MVSPEQVVESSEVAALFPSFVWKTQLRREVYEGMNASMLGAIQRLCAGTAPIPPGCCSRRPLACSSS